MEGSFFYRHRLFIAISLVLLVSGSIFFPIKIREIKAGSAVQVAENAKQTLCQASETTNALDIAKRWAAYENREHISVKDLPSLDFSQAEKYIKSQCDAAKEILSAARHATTDSEKAKAYDAANVLTEDTMEIASSMREQMYNAGVACVDSLSLAETAETTYATTNAYVDQARSFARQGNWTFCQFYSQQAVMELDGMYACIDSYNQALAMANQLGTVHDYVTKAGTYKDQSDWAFCSFYATQAIKVLQPMLPTPTPTAPP